MFRQLVAKGQADCRLRGRLIVNPWRNCLKAAPFVRSEFIAEALLEPS